MTAPDSTVVGVDACPLGWFATVIADDRVETDTFEEFEKLTNAHSEADDIFVDIPIGLPEEARRRCDEKSRNLLGSRSLSVFYPPCQNAAKRSDYQKASNEHREQTGHGLSRQAHNIREKILEVAEVVGEEYDGIVRESHPELCFAALNRQPIAYSKTSDQGRRLRMKLLSDEIEGVEAQYRSAREEYLLKEVQRDDILDSMVLAIAARNRNLTSVPVNPMSGEPRIYYPEFDTPGVEWE